MGTSVAPRLLLCKVGSLVCGLPLASVSETMRALPIDVVAGMPAFLAGVSIIRGAAVPVVDLARLLGDESNAEAARLVIVKVNERKVALSVENVDADSVSALPPLLRGASADVVAAVGALDARLLLVLEAARIFPDSMWATLQCGGART